MSQDEPSHVTDTRLATLLGTPVQSSAIQPNSSAAYSLESL